MALTRDLLHKVLSFLCSFLGIQQLCVEQALSSGVLLLLSSESPFERVVYLLNVLPSACFILSIEISLVIFNNIKLLSTTAINYFPFRLWNI